MGRAGLLCFALTLLACRTHATADATRPAEPRSRCFSIDAANRLLAEDLVEEAIDRARVSMGECPRDADLHAIVAAGAWALGDVAGSIASFRVALELDPRHFGASLGLSRALLAQGRLDEARDLAARQTAAEPKQPDPAALLARIAYADCDAVATDAAARTALAASLDYATLDVHETAAWGRTFAGVGPTCVVRGSSTELQLRDRADPRFGVDGSIGDTQVRVWLWSWSTVSRISAELVREQGLPILGRLSAESEELPEFDMVLIPSVTLGALVLESVPAYVVPTSDDGERYELALGLQVLRQIDGVVLDGPAQRASLRREPTVGSPTALELDLAMVPASLGALHPTVTIQFDAEGPRRRVTLGAECTDVDVVWSGRAALLGAHANAPMVAETTQAIPLAVGGHVLGTARLRTLDPEDRWMDDFMRGARGTSGMRVWGLLCLPWFDRVRLTYAPRDGRLWVDPPASVSP